MNRATEGIVALAVSLTVHLALGVALWHWWASSSITIPLVFTASPEPAGLPSPIFPPGKAGTAGSQGASRVRLFQDAGGGSGEGPAEESDIGAYPPELVEWMLGVATVHRLHSDGRGGGSRGRGSALGDAMTGPGGSASTAGLARPGGGTGTGGSSSSMERPADRLPSGGELFYREAPTLEQEGLSLDNIGEVRSAMLIDFRNKRNLKGYLHLPAYMGTAANVLIKFGEYLVQYGVIDLTFKVVLCDRGYRLSFQELQEFGLYLGDVEVDSDTTLATYLAQGGFAVLPTRLDGVYEQLQGRFGKRVRRVLLTLEHPVFHCFYDIGEYVFVPPKADSGCASILPLDGIELDGRLVAISRYMSYNFPGHPVSPFSRHLTDPIVGHPGSGDDGDGDGDDGDHGGDVVRPCLAYRLSMNVLVYGLIQPGNPGIRQFYKSLPAQP